MARFVKGADVSSLLELERLGARYRDGRGERDLLQILAAHGVNAVRLRLWNDPRSETGEPYGGGGNDLATTVALASLMSASTLGSLGVMVMPGESISSSPALVMLSPAMVI